MKMKMYIVSAFCMLLACISLADIIKSNLGSNREEEIVEMPTAADYIQDGLIAFYDGIENIGFGLHSSETMAWVDLTGNGRDIMIDSNYGQWTDKGIYCNSQGKAGQTNVDLPSLCTDMRHYEVCAQVLSMSAKNESKILIHLRSSSYSRIGRILFGNEYQGGIVRTLVNRTTDEADNMKHSYACTSYPDRNNVQFMMIDGIEHFAYGNSGRGEFRDGLSIGSDTYPGYHCEGYIYCIRIYDRELTQQEILHNYKVDRLRYLR